jgi:hypothetical protein
MEFLIWEMLGSWVAYVQGYVFAHVNIYSLETR